MLTFTTLRYGEVKCINKKKLLDAKIQDILINSSEILSANSASHTSMDVMPTGDGEVGARSIESLSSLE